MNYDSQNSRIDPLRSPGINRQAFEAYLLLDVSALFLRAGDHVDDESALAIVHVTEAFLRMTGYTCAEVIGKTPRIFQCDETDREELNKIRIALRKTQPFRADLLYRRRDGNNIWVEVQYIPVVDELADSRSWVSLYHDITPRKQLETELRASEAGLRGIIDASPHCVVAIDSAGHVIAFNSAAEKTFGYRRDAAIGRAVGNLIIPTPHREQFERGLARYLQTGKSTLIGRQIETRAIRADGADFPAELDVRVVQQAGPPVFAGYLRDLTDQQAEIKTLRESEERFRELAEALDSVFWLSDPTLTTMIYVSPAYERIWGRTCASLYAEPRSWLDAIHPEDRARGLHAGHYKQSLDAYSEEYRILRPDGSVRWVRNRGFPIRNAANVIYRFAGIAEDVSERKEAEQAIQCAQDRYRSLVLASAQMVWTTSPDGGMLIDSASWTEVTGQTEDTWKDVGWLNAIHPDDRDRLVRAWNHALRTKTPYDAEYRIRTKDGSYRHTHARGVPVFKQDGQIREWVGMNADITDQRRAEEELMKAKEVAESANRAKSEFLSRMSHELRTPLHAILGFSQLLEAELVQSEQRESIAQILKGGRHLLKMIDAVLEIARLEDRRRQSPTLESIVVGEAIQDALSLVMPLAFQANINVIPPSPSVFTWCAYADSQRLKQVLLNLLTNALKYNSPRGSVAIACAKIDSDMLRISISDTGAGIPTQKAHRLFTPFDRLGAEQRGIEGTGLGLALSRALVTEMGGRIGVDSVPGQGSTFWVDLPLIPSAQNSLATRIPDQRPIAFSATSAGKVLYIEDNLDNFRLVECILRRRPGVSLLSALHGRMGLALARQHQPDLILLDLHLPDLGGEELVDFLKSEPATRDIPLLVLSADAWPHNAQRLLRAGILRYLTKPIDVKELLEIVDDILRKKEVSP